jgi:iron complex outermembrane recepter protein
VRRPWGVTVGVWLLAGVEGKVWAQTPAEAPARRAIEEIVVTAQRREENLQEVPISVTVVDDEFIADHGITDYRDLMLYTPNAHIDPGNGLFPDINIRGFGSALSNKAFEQSVGIAIDGVPYGRASYFQGPLFDLERVEVLRGPQGTLFGRNTTSGLLNVVTKQPTDEYTGHVSLEYGELDRQRYEAAVGGPVVKGWLNARVAGLLDERDGTVENTTDAIVPGANEHMNSRERKALRFQLAAPDLAGVSVVASYELVDLDIEGIGWEPDRIPDRTKPFFRQFDPDVDFDKFNHVGSVDTAEFNRNRAETLVVNARYEIGAGWALAGVGGYSKNDVKSLFDDDFLPAPMTFNTGQDDNPQTTAELRVSSPTLSGFLGLSELFGFSLGETELLAGIFYQDRKLENSDTTIDLNLPVFAQFAAYNMNETGVNLPLDAFIGPEIQIGTLGVFDTTAVHARTTILFGQKLKSYAGFSHLKWRLTERWEIQYGMRFTHEEKDGSWDRSYSQPAGNAFIVLGGEQFVATRSRSEFAFTPKASLAYDWTDEIRFYFSWSKGFKAGGYNENVFNNTDAALEFKAEKATAYELGAKMQLLEGTATLNVALFRQDVTDFQVYTLPPLSVATTVVNAGEARAQGLEADGVWLPTSWLTLAGTLTFNDSEFLDFPFGQCSFDASDTDGNGDGRCDHEGQPLFRTPKWASNLGATARYPIAALGAPERVSVLSLQGVDVFLGGTFEWQDVQYLERTFDPRVRQSPFFRFGLSFGFGNEQQGWSARLGVDNLTDRKTAILIRDVPFGGGNFVKLPEPPRLIYGAFRYAF